MKTNSILLKLLCFTGPEKPDALLTFNDGLNVLYGASDTGKSFVVEAMDFMLGATSELRDIPERSGYDRIFLGLELTAQKPITLMRSTQGGNFLLFNGLHKSLPEDQQGFALASKHNSENTDNVSGFLLKELGMQGKRLKKNAKGETRSISFRDLAHLTLIDETTIQKKGSPIETGQVIFKTVEYSLFKYFAYGN